jgi:hypothetical protein
MSTSNANAYLSVSSPTTFSALSSGVSIAASAPSPAAPNTGSFGVLITDANGNAMAAGTTIAVSSGLTVGINGTNASVTTGCNASGGPTTSYYTIPGGLTVGGDVVVIGITAPTSPGNASVTLTVTSPESKSTTTFLIQVTVT